MAERPAILRGFRAADALALAAVALALGSESAQAQVIAQSGTDPSTAGADVAWQVPGSTGVLARGGQVTALPVSRLIAGYRGIFFAMLTLALSMVLYGALVKVDALGGSDGFNMGRPTLLGQALPDASAHYILFVLTIALSGLLALATRIYFDSTRGLVSLAVRENELRVEYLGGSVRQAMAELLGSFPDSDW